MNTLALALYVAVFVLALALVAAITLPSAAIPTLISLAEILR